MRKNNVKVTTKIVSDEDVLGGTPVVEGTRVPADNVLAEVQAGTSTMEVFRHYPSLPPDGVEACLRWNDAGRPFERSDLWIGVEG